METDILKPGILTDKQITDLINTGKIKSTSSINHKSQIQPNTLDLTLSSHAYKLRSSFTPTRKEKIEDILSKYAAYEFNLSSKSGGVLEKGITYLIPLRECTELPDNVWAHANPKSSIGRVDVLVRLISEGNPFFDELPLRYNGKLYLEVTPLSFPLRLREGDSLNQIRFINGKPVLDIEQLNNLYITRLSNGFSLLYDSKRNPVKVPSINNGGLLLTSELSSGTLVYKSKKNTTEIDIRRRDYDPEDFFEIIKIKDDEYIVNQDEFILIPGKEFISVPQQDVCAEIIAINLQIGSFRSHYAGFFDSGFGCESNEESLLKGNQPTLEIKVFDVPFRIKDAQSICNLRFYWNCGGVSVPYGNERGSNYQEQKGAKLPKFFKT